VTGSQELTIPKKRNVKELNVALSALDSGTGVSATFFDERYGAFNIKGAALRSPSLGAYTLAGRPIEQNMKPDKSIQTLSVSPDSTPEAEQLTDELADAVGALTHGDLVLASFRDPVYGEFTVTGVSVWSRVGNAFLVGGWIIGQDGEPAPRLQGVATVSAAGAHVHPVPKQITTVANDV